MILTTADVSMTDAFSDDGGASGGSKAVGRKDEAGFVGTALFGSASLHSSEKIEYHIHIMLNFIL